MSDAHAWEPPKLPLLRPRGTYWPLALFPKLLVSLLLGVEVSQQLCPFSRVQNLLNQKFLPSPQIPCAPGFICPSPPQILEHWPLYPARLELGPWEQNSVWDGEPHWPCDLTSPLPLTTGLLSILPTWWEREPTAKEGTLGGYDSLAAPPSGLLWAHSHSK